MNCIMSPPASAGSPSVSLDNVGGSSFVLPTPRRHPLRPGSDKEIALINYVDNKMLLISRRYGKKGSEPDEIDDTPGYVNMDEVLIDVDPLIDIVWVSGTTYLQISYFLSLAGVLLGHMPSFAFSTKIFRTLAKLDMAFASLLQPSVSSGAQSSLSMTDKVRVKSLIEETRVVAVNRAFVAGYSASVRDLSLDDEDTDSEDEDTDSEDEDDESRIDNPSLRDDLIAMQLSKVYKKTLEIVGDTLTIS